MKVSDLIEALRALPSDAIVTSWDEPSQEFVPVHAAMLRYTPNDPATNEIEHAQDGAELGLYPFVEIR